MMKGPIDAATLPSTPSELTDSLTAYKPQHAGWSPGAPVPYALVAAALDAVSATRSRLTKELVLTNAMRSVLALGSQAADIEAVAFLLSPAKDAQSGGHRLRPDWHPDNKPLGITHGAINAAILEATGASRSQLSAAYAKVRDSGDAAVIVRDGRGGGHQMLLVKPARLSAAGVHKTLLGLGTMSGTGVEKAKAAKLASLLRAAVGSELKWLVRSFVPHMACGISLEASVLPALAGAFLVHSTAVTSTAAAAAAAAAGRGGSDAALPVPSSASSSPSSLLPSPERIQRAQDAMRRGYSQRPDVRALIDVILECTTAGPSRDAGSSSDGEAASLHLLSQRLEAVCTLRAGVPSQPMLAKPCTSIADAIKMLRSGVSAPSQAVSVVAEYKYDGQRAQIHRTAEGAVRIFSRKLDDMTSKYPDVVAALRRSARSSGAFIVDAEIVPIQKVVATASANEVHGGGGETVAAAGADGGMAGVEAGVAATAADLPPEDEASTGHLGTFQSLSTRKRKNVTTANAAASSVAVCVVLFDLLMRGDASLLHSDLRARQRALREEFAPLPSLVSFATSIELRVGGPSVGVPSVAASARTSTEGAATGAPSSDDAGRSDGGGGSSPGDDAAAAIEAALRRAVEAGCEGLMLKRLDDGYEPSWGTRRSDAWVKCKKDYIEGMGDSVDLVPIGGWRGQGRKKRWVSPWLMATYDARSGTLGSVCRVMSGFSDAFYRANTIKYLGKEMGVDDDAAESDGADGDGGDGDGAEAADDGVDGEDEGLQLFDEDGDGNGGGGGSALLLDAPAAGVETGERAQFWFEPCEVWELRGADVTVSPVHMAAAGLVHSTRGLSMRFPRFVRKRDDKRLADATTPQQLAALYLKQTQGQAAEP